MFVQNRILTAEPLSSSGERCMFRMVIWESVKSERKEWKET
jgi:hypothetical protein